MKEKTEKTKVQISTSLDIKDYDTFKKLCHLEFRQMADILRDLALLFIEKNKKKLK